MKYDSGKHTYSNGISVGMMKGPRLRIKVSIASEMGKDLGHLAGLIKAPLLSTTALVCVCILLAPLVIRADTFNGYQAGNWPSPTLSNSTDCVEGTDYIVTVSNTGSPVTVLSIHGGGIEAFTSNISAALANLFGYKRYDFKAQGTTQCLQGRSNTDVLHITATHFDDPRAVSLVGSSSKAVAIHGYADSRGYARGVICVGGADASARNTFISQVNSNASSWSLYALTPIDAPSAGSGTCGDLGGTASANIVNRTSSGGGLQLELSKGLRTDLANTSDHSYDTLRNIIYGGISAAMQTVGQWTCSDGWYITGYYVPREDELPGTAEQIYVEGVGNLSFSQNFLNETRTEGWGITSFGWALGYYSSAWHRSDAGPLDASGNVLTDGTIAVDRSVIPAGAQVQISTLPSPWGSKTFWATDTGGGIIGQHIDVFTGTGATAQQETFRITSSNNRVCVTSSSMTDPSRYGFENGTQGWQSSGGAIAGLSSSDLHSFYGDRSLAVSILGQVDTQQAYVLSPGVPAGKTITFRIWVPVNSGLSAIQPYVMEGSAGGWRWTGTYKTIGQLRLGEWNALQVIVPSDATLLYSLGVEFFSDGSNANSAYIDSINW
jgi:phage replication-related protein YjqB (UPF0714/DUF867 family)/3D (Asp-Asp-Asp) domain-containing protein